MTFKHRQNLLLIFAVILIVISPGLEGWLWSQLQGKEKLLFEEIPLVITAFRRVQPITEAASTITVITSEDIKYSGATTIPDILRQVAGVDVMTITARDQQVGIRGFNSPLSNKLVVLIDGLSVYEELYGSIFWDLFPVGLEEIHRIEVVKSPASSLYGANAYSGIVSIITKTPGQLAGTSLQVTSGTQNTFIGSLLHGGDAAEKKIQYKISSQWDKTGDWRDPDKSSEDVIRLNAQIEYRPAGKIKMALSGGRIQVKDKMFLPNELYGTRKLKTSINCLKLDFEYGSLKFRAFLRQTEANNAWVTENGEQSWQAITYDTELFHSFHIGKSHSLIWGLNYRYNMFEKNALFPDDHYQHLWAFFLEDEIVIGDRFRLTMGGRYDRHPLAGGRFSPRANISYAPFRNNHHVFRLSVAKAFHNPSFMNSYVYFELPLDFTLPSPLPQILIPFTFIGQGNREMKPEGITAYEIGYHSNWSRHFQLDVNLFYDLYTDFFISNNLFTYYESDEIFPGSPGGVFIKTWVNSVQNGSGAWGIGGEINLDFSMNHRISGFVNYSYQQITQKEDDPSTIGFNEKDRVRPEYPKHKINAGLRLFFKNGIAINFLGHWVDKSERIISDSRREFSLTPVEDYFIFNTTMVYTPRDEKIELTFSVFNLSNHKHYQYPTNENLSVPKSSRVGRKITFSLRFKF